MIELDQYLLNYILSFIGKSLCCYRSELLYASQVCKYFKDILEKNQKFKVYKYPSNIQKFLLHNNYKTIICEYHDKYILDFEISYSTQIQLIDKVNKAVHNILVQNNPNSISKIKYVITEDEISKEEFVHFMSATECNKVRKIINKLEFIRCNKTCCSGKGVKLELLGEIPKLANISSIF